MKLFYILKKSLSFLGIIALFLGSAFILNTSAAVCSPTAACTGSSISGSTSCTVQNTGATLYCCPAGSNIKNNQCVSTSSGLAVTAVPTTSVVPTCVKMNSAGNYPPKNSDECVELEAGANKINLFPFLPQFGLDDFISAAATILLAFIVIFFGIRAVTAAFKWTRNQSGDKEKKEAIKRMSEGVIGVIIASSAYIVVLILKGVFFGDAQIVNCSNLYFNDTYSYLENYRQAIGSQQGKSNTGYIYATPEFKRCMELAGKSEVLSQTGKFADLVNNVSKECGDTGQKLFNSTTLNTYAGLNLLIGSFNSTTVPSGVNILISDRQALNKCFADQVKKL